jgi:hypothetical protein
VVRFLEVRLGTDWKTGLYKLFGGSATVAVLPDGGSLLIVDAEDANLLSQLHEFLVALIKNEQAKIGQVKKLASQKVNGVTVWTFNGEEAHAILGKRLVLANRSATLKAVLDQRQQSEDRSLASVPAYQAARKAIGDKVAAAAFVNLAVLKNIPAFQQGLKQSTSEPMTALLLAGVLDSLRVSNWLALGLQVQGPSLTLEAVLDGKPASTSLSATFACPAKAGEGALPPLAVPRQIANLSFFRDLHAFYAAKDKLFPERTSGLIFFENMMGIFFSGRDLTEEIFGEMGAQIRFVVAAQEYDKTIGTPQIQIPAFAVILPLHHPKEFNTLAEEAWQKFVGLINITRGQKAEPGMIIDRDLHGDIKYSVSFFSKGKKEDKERLDIRFNYRPALTRVGQFLVLSSSDGLLKDLIDALKKQAQGPAKVLAGTHSLVELNGVNLAAILKANRKNLVSQSMVEKGNTQEQAETETDLLISLAQYLGQARLVGAIQDGQQRLSLEIKLNLP